MITVRRTLRKCRNCNLYTMKETCPHCGAPSVTSIPPRFSPDDRYGEYRRTAIRDEYGENGKYGHIQ